MDGSAVVIGVAVTFVLILVVGVFAGYWRERTAWNGGRCRMCAGEWKSFDMDSQGGRGYSCPCGKHLWVSWPIDGRWEATILGLCWAGLAVSACVGAIILGYHFRR